MEHSLAKNSLYNFVYRMFNVIFPLISAAYVARILSADGVGKVAGAQNIAQYFVAFATLGMGNYGTKMIAKALTKEETTKVFSELFLINAVSTSICTLLYYAMIRIFPFFHDEHGLFLVAGISILLNFFNVDWFYQGKEEYRYIMMRSIIVKIASLISLFIFVKEKEDYINYALIVCLATAGNYLFNVINLRKYTGITVRKLDLSKHLGPVIILLASSIAIDLYTMVDTTMLSIMRTSEEVGYYTNAVKVIRMASNCIIAMGAVILPRLSLYFKEGKEKEFKETCFSVVRLLLFFSMPAAFGIGMIADNVVMVLFGEGFAGAILTIRILSILIIIFSIAGGFLAPVLIAMNKEKQYFTSVCSGAVVNIAMNSLLIPKIGYNGAAVASVCAEVIVMMVQMFHARHVLTKLISWKTAYKSLVPVAAMVAGIIVVRILCKSDIASMLGSLVCGAVVYFASGMIIKNEQATVFVGKIIKTRAHRGE